METPVSLGYFYTAITKQIGFKSGEEGKTMGLASYGEPIYIDVLRKLINCDEHGKLHCVFNSDKVDKSPVPWWLNEDIKSEPATPEEQAEMERMIREITGEDSDSDE